MSKRAQHNSWTRAWMLGCVAAALAAVLWVNRSPVNARAIGIGLHAPPVALRIAPLPEHAPAAVSYTFDDGLASQAIAAELLEAHGYTGTFFINPHPIDVSHPRHLSSSQLRELADAGHEIGNHGWTHVDLTELDRKELHEQTLKSHTWLSATTSHETTSFAYPFGARNARTDDWVHKRHLFVRGREAVLFGGDDFTADDANQAVLRAVRHNDWLVVILHGVGEGYEPITEQVLHDHLSTVQSLGAIRVAPFGAISRYRALRDNTRMNVIRETPHSITFELKAPKKWLERYEGKLAIRVIPQHRYWTDAVYRVGQNPAQQAQRGPNGEVLIEARPTPGSIDQTVSVFWQ